MEHEKRNGTGHAEIENETGLTTIYFDVGERSEVACFHPDRITRKELKELFRSAAEAGPLDIVKLRHGEKLLNVSPNLPSNSPENPYTLQRNVDESYGEKWNVNIDAKVVGAHPSSIEMLEADLLRALERRVSALEREVRERQEVNVAPPLLPLRELKRQMDVFRKKLETTEHLSWLGFYKQLPEPVSTEACRRLQYRRKSDTVKRTVREKFRNICDVTVSSGVRQWLRSPGFDAKQWEDEELLLMLQTMFIELDLVEKLSIPLTSLQNFLYEVYVNYNEVPFHNFRHCFCVAQMMYAITWTANLVAKLGHLEVFVLLVSCICHDLDHPGYNNIYQINARTELALRYNDISPLENHHCSVAFRVLESPDCNILVSLDPPTYRRVREGIIRCILATDMARHNEILGQFVETTPDFDYSNKSHTNLLSMVLIKVADISNEARPMDVAEPWLDRLLQEFFKQSDAEKLEGLPVTPFMDRDKVTKPSSQCSFIGFVLLPLFEALGELITELQDFIVQPVRDALEYYRRLNEAAKDERHHRRSIVDLGESNATSISTYMVKSTSSTSMRSKKSCSTIRSRSRSIDDEDNATIDEAETWESSDPETATEVEISEKTLKFKISTEGGLTGRKSYPGSRKGSRDKSSLDYYNHELARAVRDNEREFERERRRSRGEVLSSDVSSPTSTRSVDGPRIVEELERDELVLIVRDVEKNGNAVVRSEGSGGPTESYDGDSDAAGCSCDIDRTDKGATNNHKSLLSRLRNFTDRLSISFDSRESPGPKQSKSGPTKTLSKSNSVASSRSSRTDGEICKRCNLLKIPTKIVCEPSSQDCAMAKECKTKKNTDEISSRLQRMGSSEKRATTLPKASRRSRDAKNKRGKNSSSNEKQPSASMEILSGNTNGDGLLAQHRRNFSSPEGRDVGSTSLKGGECAKLHDFQEVETRRNPEIVLNPSTSSSTLVDKDVCKVEIRRSSASMEDISKITKQNETLILGCRQEEGSEEHHTGSLDSMLHKEAEKASKKCRAFPSPGTSKKYSAGIFSRFKSGMSIDSARSSSGTLSDQTPSQQSPNQAQQSQYQPQQSQYQQQVQGGWISSLAASFRPKRQTNEGNSSPQRSHCHNHEPFK